MNRLDKVTEVMLKLDGFTYYEAGSYVCVGSWSTGGRGVECSGYTEGGLALYPRVNASFKTFAVACRKHYFSEHWMPEWVPYECETEEDVE